MMLVLTFRMKLRSNYHIGAGYGKGFNVDSALLRGSDGKPVIRGATLAGLLRGGAYRLLGLGPLERRGHDRSDVLTRLFGSADFPKAWQISTARLVKGSGASLIREAEDVQRVRIDPRVRRAEPGKLFVQEEGLSGSVFRFKIAFLENDEAVVDDAAFLVAAARFVRGIGRSRRRGLGECIIKLDDAEGVNVEKPKGSSWEDWFLDRFRRSWLEGKPAEAAPKGSWSGPGELQASLVEGAQAKDDPIRIRVIMRLDEPTIIASRGLAGNQYYSLPYIPGSVLLGTLAGMAARLKRCSYDDFVALFLRGKVLFPTLYPAWHYQSSIYPAIPVPFALHVCSACPPADEDEYHGMHPAWDLRETCAECGSRLEPLGGFVVLRSKPPYTLKPGQSSETHIRIDEDTGRVEAGQLYGYTALNPGQYFVGELVCYGEHTWKHLQDATGIVEKTALAWRIGKARSRGYGEATVWLEQCKDRPPLWIQLPVEDRVEGRLEDQAGNGLQTLTMTLLTDTIIGNRWGQQASGFAEKGLAEALSLGAIRICDVFAGHRVVDGFNAHLGLPRWRDTALRAGSAVRFTLKSPPVDLLDRLAKIETEGIGMRRNEGFGRVAFNHPVYNNCETLGDSAIQLEPKMWVASSSMDLFVKGWDRQLDGLLPAGKRLGREFFAVSRWLHSNNLTPPQELVALLEALGQPDERLKTMIGEYGDRSKPNVFEKENKDGIDIHDIRRALESLGGFEPRNWPQGIASLADRLAALVREGESTGGAT